VPARRRRQFARKHRQLRKCLTACRPLAAGIRDRYSPRSAASSRPLQFIDQPAGLPDAQVFGVVDAESLLQRLSEVESLAIGDRVQRYCNLWLR